jgi:catechol 2,3-dioxygenase-like lactoylglutathione lyase family enzyme
MRLGENVSVTLGIPSLEESLPFYQKMGFRVADASEEPYPWAVLDDGQIQIGLHQDGMTYQGLTYFAADMDERIARLEEKGVDFAVKKELGGRTFQAIFMGADELAISLIRYADARPPARRAPNSRLHIFGEYSLGVDNLDFSIAYWNEFGFETRHRAEEPYPWAILGDGLLVMGLHQTDDFRGPTLTYFAPDMDARVARLRENGVPVTPTPMGGATVAAPDGQTFFLFTGEI